MIYFGLAKLSRNNSVNFCTIMQIPLFSLLVRVCMYHFYCIKVLFLISGLCVKL